MCAIVWIFQIGKRSSIKHSKTRNTTNKSENLHAILDSQLPIVLGFLPPEGVPGSSWQPLAAPGKLLAATKPIFSSIFAPGGRKIIITRRYGQLQSSYFACADLWTCWIRFWYSRSPELTKMLCFWQFSFLYYFICFMFFSILGSAAWGFSL